MDASEDKLCTLPCNGKDDVVGRATIISVASVLLSLQIPIYPEQLFYDPKYRNSQAVASFLQKRYKVVLWMITKEFASAKDMTTQMAEWYQLSSSNCHAQVITVFLDCNEIAERIPQCLLEAGNTHFISSKCLSVQNKAFADLHDTLHQILYCM